MARVFTTTFQYKGQTYSAVVAECAKSLTITLMDGVFQLVLPLEGESFSTTSINVVDGSAHNLHDARSLVAAALMAVEPLLKREQHHLRPQDGELNAGADTR